MFSERGILAESALGDARIGSLSGMNESYDTPMNFSRWNNVNILSSFGE
jgi:hypothetical protein